MMISSSTLHHSAHQRRETSVHTHSLNPSDIKQYTTSHLQQKFYSATGHSIFRSYYYCYSPLAFWPSYKNPLLQSRERAISMMLLLNPVGLLRQQRQNVKAGQARWPTNIIISLSLSVQIFYEPLQRKSHFVWYKVSFLQLQHCYYCIRMLQLGTALFPTELWFQTRQTSFNPQWTHRRQRPLKSL